MRKHAAIAVANLIGFKRIIDYKMIIEPEKVATLNDAHYEAVIYAMMQEMGAYGFKPDYEPNHFGLYIEDAIDSLNKLRKEKPKTESV